MKSPVSLEAPANTHTLNALLKAMGDGVRVARHYDACSLYFYDGDADGWYTSTVAIARASDFSFSRWIEELASLRCSSRNWRPGQAGAGEEAITRETARLIAAALATGRVFDPKAEPAPAPSPFKKLCDRVAVRERNARARILSKVPVESKNLSRYERTQLRQMEDAKQIEYHHGTWYATSGRGAYTIGSSSSPKV